MKARQLAVRQSVDTRVAFVLARQQNADASAVPRVLRAVPGNREKLWD
jgi:hypothetical protein